MPLIFGDKESIKLAKSKISRKRPKYYRYLSDCCSVYVEAYCDWETPKDETVQDYAVVPSVLFGLMSNTRPTGQAKAHSGITLIEKCSQCKKSCITVKVPVY